MMEQHNNEEFVNDDCLIPTQGRRRKNTKKDYYCNNEPGQVIINAVTGHPYNGYKIGSKEETEFWRVIIPVTNDDMTTTAKLYYESPEEYEVHRNTFVDESIKRNWRNRVSKKNVFLQPENQESTIVK